MMIFNELRNIKLLLMLIRTREHLKLYDYKTRKVAFKEQTVV